MKRVLLSWSTGKDSAWTLRHLWACGDVEVVGLLTTFNEEADRVAMHGVRNELAQAQARATNVPLWSVPLPWPCSNEIYEARMGAVCAEARKQGVTHMAFGDLFLEEIRAYREKNLRGTGIEPMFPIWGTSEATPKVAREMVTEGFEAILTCVDTRQIPASFLGRRWNAELLSELPEGVDPCGENGEFHTFCFRGPIFDRPIAAEVTEERVESGDFVFVDVRLSRP